MADHEILKEILQRIDRLEQPYQHLAQSITAGVLKALNENGALLAAARTENSKQDEPNLIEPALLKSMASKLEPQEGICVVLGALPDGAIVTVEGLAILFKKHPISIRRAIARGELPPPVRFFSGCAWTAGAIVRHLEKRLEQEKAQEERFRRKIAGHTP